MKQLVVRAKEGCKCPMENIRGKHISDTPVEVPDTPYYRGLLRDGSLVLTELKASPARDKALKKKEEAGTPSNRPPKPVPVPKEKQKAEQPGDGAKADEPAQKAPKASTRPPKPVPKGAKASDVAEGDAAAAADTGAVNMSPAGEPENN